MYETVAVDVSVVLSSRVLIYFGTRKSVKENTQGKHGLFFHSRKTWFQSRKTWFVLSPLHFQRKFSKFHNYDYLKMLSFKLCFMLSCDVDYIIELCFIVYKCYGHRAKFFYFLFKLWI